MGEKAKDKKGFITEEDTATLLQRYTATTVLALLQEVAHWPPEVKIDWNQLVAKTTTGISNAREYQMVWHHLAYRDALLDKFDNETPLDDDSDLEYEVEVLPAVTGEASTEAAACVKVLIASGLPSDSSHLNGTTVEAPLIINIPNGQSCKTYENSQPTASAKGMNITVPVSVQKQILPATTTSAAAKVEGVDSIRPASNSMAPRKKRKKWSEEEDLELISAVEKYGVGNWTTILKGDFKGDRTANQLSQRWGIVKKRQKNLGVGEGGKPSSKPSEALEAAHKTMNHFLDDGPNRTANTIGTAGTIANSNSAGTNANSKSAGTNANSKSAVTNGTSNSGLHTITAEGLNATKPYQMGSLGSTPKARVTSKKTLPKSKFSSDPVRATAVAAGARIATPLDAALLKAAQAKNPIHIMPPKGGSSNKSLPGGLSVKSEPHPNVHHIRTGPAATPPSSYPPTAVTASARHPGSLKALSQTSQQASKIDKKINGVNCSHDAELLPKQEDKKSIISVSECAPMGQVQDVAVLSGIGQDDRVQEDKVDSKQKAVSESSLTNAQNSAGSLNTEKSGSNDKAVIGVQAEEKPSAKDEIILCSQVSVGGGDNPSAVNSEDQNTEQEQTQML